MTDAWKRRELERFESGAYKPVPWHDEMWWQDLLVEGKLYEHFAHVSADDPTQVAFTENAAKGALDRQTRMRPGRYLARFVPTLDADTVRKWAGVYAAENAPSGLLFARTEEEIEHVYTNGPDSCMSHPASAYDAPIHPARVYAAGDLSVAYIRGADRITARAVVWEAQRLHSRVYGDATRMIPALVSAGYLRGSFEGARLLRVEHGDGFVCPYIDGHDGLRDAGDALIIDSGGRIGCQQVNGLTCPGGVPCGECGETYDEEDLHYHDAVDCALCETCAERLIGYCEECESNVLADDTRCVDVLDQRGRVVSLTVCDNCMDREFSTCAHGDCDAVVRDSDAVRDAEGRFICATCAEDHYTFCEGCSEHRLNADVNEEGFCVECAKEDDDTARAECA